VRRFDPVIGTMCIGHMPFDASAIDRTIQQGSVFCEGGRSATYILLQGESLLFKSIAVPRSAA
jgi:hypothetical protein